MSLEQRLRALDVGSGHNPVSKSGWNRPHDTDIYDFTTMDKYHSDALVKWDFNQTPWPFLDDDFDAVFLRHTLEHVRRDKLVDVMREIYRVSRHGGFVMIRVPYWNSESFAGDPTHHNPFIENTFRQFCSNGGIGTEYYNPALFELTEVIHRFSPKFRLIPKPVLRELMHIVSICDELWVTLHVNKGPSNTRLKDFQPHHGWSFNVPTTWHTAVLYGLLFYGSMSFLFLSFLDLVLHLVKVF